MITDKRISEVAAQWYYQAPFLSEFLLRFKYIESADISTFGVGFDKCLCLWYNREFMHKLSELELKGVLAHEILHIIKKHSIRFSNVEKTLERAAEDEKGSKKKALHNVFNYAADTVINEIIFDDFSVGGERLTLPPKVWRLNMPIFKEYKGPLLTENIYEYLMEKVKYRRILFNLNGDLFDKDGNPIDDKEPPEEDSIIVDIIDEHSFMGDLNSEDAQRDISDTVRAAINKGWGTMSGSGLSKIKELLEPEKIPIGKLLRKSMQEHYDGCILKSSTYLKMNRRGYQELPGYKKHGSNLNVVVDVSGSCFSEGIQSLFFSELDYMSNIVKDITLIQFDTQVQKVSKYRKGDWRSIELTGCGGTVFQPLFDYLKSNKMDRRPTIIFTDGCFDWKLDSKGIKPLWVLTDEVTPTFGTSFVLRKKE